MTAAFAAALELDAYLEEGWVSLLSHQVGELSGRDGIGRTGYMDRVASLGSIRTKLNNLDGQFTPGGESALPGWRGSVPVRLNVIYDNQRVNLFVGRLDTARGRTVFPAFLEISAYDWMQAASSTTIKNQAMLSARTIDQAIRILMAQMSWQPARAQFPTGQNIFPTLFDGMARRASPASEMAKLVASELGYLYLRRDETLVLETMGERTRLLPVQTSPAFALADEFCEPMLFEDGEEALFEDGEVILFNDIQAATFQNSADMIPVVTELCETMLFEDGEEALFEDGEVIAFNDVEEAVFAGDFADMDVVEGPNYFNFASVSAYPRNVDSDPVRLYRLGEPMELPAGVPVTLKGSWTNPTSGQIVGGTDVDTPTENTNYTANAKKGGGGANLTGQLVIQSWEPSSNGFEATLVSPAGGWLRKWEIHGKGVYRDDRAFVELGDSKTIERDGETSLAIDQRYLAGYGLSKGAVEAELLFQRERRLEGTRIHFMANRSPKQMMAFLYLQTGKVIRVISERHEIDHFYVVCDRTYRLDGKIFSYSFGLRRVRSQADMAEVEVQFAVAAATTQAALGLGVLPNWATRKITFFCEVFVSGVADVATLMSLPYLAGGEDAYFRLQISSGGTLLARTSQFETAGMWTSTGDAVGSGTWVPVAVTYDSSALANVPSFYINGALQSLGAATQPTGSRVTDEPLTFLEVGGHFREQSSTSYDLRIRRQRWFADALTAEEILALSKAPADMGLYSERLVLGGFGVPGEYAPAWYDEQISAEKRVVDLVAGTVSTEISGAPTIRAIT